MSELKKGYTQIVEPARQMLGISRDEYALCSYLQYRAADPRQRVPGWCCDEKAEIAEFVGVTRVGLYKMANRIDGLGLIETGVSGWRVTGKWIDTETNCKQSLHGGVNKVDTACKQSLHGGVNKVDTRNKVEYDISMNEQEEEEKDASLSSSTFGAENKNRRAADLPAPAPQRYVRTYSPEDPDISIVEPAPMPEYKRDERAASPVELRRVNIPEEIERLKGDHTVLEAFTMSRKIPYNHFADYIAAFQIDITGRGETYNSPRQFRQHFFNWCGTRWERELKRQQQQKPSGIPHGIRKI